MWSESPRHAELCARLRGVARAGRMPHAWLLVGEPGVGKSDLATWLVSLRWCEASDDGARPCGVCGACRRVASGNHPDLTVVSRDPDEEVDPKNLGSRFEITVAQVREHIVATLGLTAVEGGGRAVIVRGAEDMNVEAQNALLKTLEEPPAGCLLVLVADREGGLLDTIRSRCQELRVPPVSDDDLGREPGADDQELVALARGRPGRLADLERVDRRAVFEAVDAVVTGGCSGPAFAARLGAVVAQAAGDEEGGLPEAEARPLVLELVHLRLRDLALGPDGPCATGPCPDPSSLPPRDRLLTMEQALIEAHIDMRRHLPTPVSWMALGTEFEAARMGAGSPSSRYI